jgi:hypothetical protein
VAASAPATLPSVGTTARGQDARDPERHPEEEAESDRGTQELGQVGGHGHQLHQRPHHQDDGAREARPAVLRQIVAGGDPQFGGERLNHHRHQVTGEDHPEKGVTELRAALNVGGEVPGVHVGHAGDERRPEEGEEAGQRTLPAPLLEDIRCSLDRPGVGRHLADHTFSIGASSIGGLDDALAVTEQWPQDDSREVL